ncbi:hypothetical protein KUCAC02_026492, partial [Chaenocephalus aceratus]
FSFIVCQLHSLHKARLSPVHPQFISLPHIHIPPFVFPSLVPLFYPLLPYPSFDAPHNPRPQSSPPILAPNPRLQSSPPIHACFCSRGGGVIWRIRPVAGLLLCQSNRQGSGPALSPNPFLHACLPGHRISGFPSLPSFFTLILFSFDACLPLLP